VVSLAWLADDPGFFTRPGKIPRGILTSKWRHGALTLHIAADLKISFSRILRMILNVTKNFRT
jgi:hypothetical protein